MVFAAAMMAAFPSAVPTIPVSDDAMLDRLGGGMPSRRARNHVDGVVVVNYLVVVGVVPFGWFADLDFVEY